jgi:hypothetical protein
VNPWWWALPAGLGLGAYLRGLWVAVFKDEWSTTALLLFLAALIAALGVGSYQQSHEGHATTPSCQAQYQPPPYNGLGFTTYTLGCDG